MQVKFHPVFTMMLLFLVISCGEDTPDAPAWHVAGTRGVSTGEASFLCLSTTPAGTAVLAYRDESVSGKAVVKQFSGKSWQTLGTEGVSAGESRSLALECLGETPYLAYRDGSVAGKISVITYQSGSWTNLGNPGFSDAVVIGQEPASASGIRKLALATPSGTSIFVACITDPDEQLRVYRWDGDAWSNITGNLTNAKMAELALAADGTDSVYLAFLDDSRNGYVSSWDGSNWSAAGDAGGLFTVQGGRSVSLAIVSNEPWLAYSAVDGDVDYSGGSTDPDRAIVKKLVAGEWQIQGGTNITPTTATEVSLAAADDGTLYLGYLDWSGIAGASVHEFAGDSWTLLGTRDCSVSSVKYLCLAACNTRPWIAFREDSGTAMGKATLMYWE